MKAESSKLESANYITSSRAAQLSQYSQDYVGQLCRGGSIECKRVSGEWKVELTSLLAYKKRFNPDRATIVPQEDLGNSIDKNNEEQETVIGSNSDDMYISSQVAAKRTGYSQDYIGQLARSGSVKAKKVGRKWFIDQDSLTEHKDHNDTLLAAVQAEAVGVISAPQRIVSKHLLHDLDIHKHDSIHTIPIVTYKHDDGSLVPGTAMPISTVEPLVPEVKSMPVMAATSTPIKRRDLRSRPIYKKETARYNPENQASSAMVSITFNDENTDGPKGHFNSLAKICVSTISLVSIVLIFASIAIPEVYHTHITKFANSVGITIDNKSINSTELGKKLLNTTSAKITYKKIK